MNNHPKHSRHHIVARSIGGSNHPDNVVRLVHRYHVAFHAVFANMSPALQVARLMELNGSALTRDFHGDIMRVIETAIAEPGYAYKNGILRPDKND